MADALRGFAVMAILLVHNIEHFIYSVYPADSPSWLTTLDSEVYRVTFFLFAGKAYAIFAILFGLTYHIQLSNRQRQGQDFTWRFMWRLLLLAGFACLNAAFFPAGDVLLLFVIVGGVLPLIRNCNNRVLLVVTAFFLCQPMEWFNFFAIMLFPDYNVPNLHVGRMYMKVTHVTQSGNFGDFLLCNLSLGQKASLFWAVGTGRIFQIAGLFILGMYLGRRNLFVGSPESIRFWKRTLVIAAILFLPLYFVHKEIIPSTSSLRQIATILNMWKNLAFTFVLISGFILTWELTGFRQHTAGLQLYGRMSLTNYISQSIIGALIYFPIGLNLAPRCGITVSLLISIVVFIIQMCFSRWWLSHHRQGPLETIWHRLTWLHFR